MELSRQEYIAKRGSVGWGRGCSEVKLNVAAGSVYVGEARKAANQNRLGNYFSG